MIRPFHLLDRFKRSRGGGKVAGFRDCWRGMSEIRERRGNARSWIKARTTSLSCPLFRGQANAACRGEVELLVVLNYPTALRTVSMFWRARPSGDGIRDSFLAGSRMTSREKESSATGEARYLLSVAGYWERERDAECSWLYRWFV